MQSSLSPRVKQPNRFVVWTLITYVLAACASLVAGFLVGRPISTWGGYAEYSIALVVGSLAGLHVSTWGAYKDGPREGFTWSKYFRSTVLGAVLGVAAYPFFGWDMTEPAALFVYFGICYVLERCATETWKTFWREEDQSKYSIPTQFSAFGKPIKNFKMRMSIGVGCAVVVLGTFTGLYALDRAYLDWPRWLVVLAFGGIGGWFYAAFGAWRDAPIEGFETLKFFRFPLVTTLCAWLVALFTSSYVLISVGGLGFAILVIETYKSFFRPNKAPGKFEGMPITNPEFLETRESFVPICVGIWAAVLITLSLALLRLPTELAF